MSSLRGAHATKQSSSWCHTLDCFASLAMTKIRAKPDHRMLKRAEEAAERDDGDERDDCVDDSDHDDVDVTLAVRNPADRKETHHRAVMRQEVERARADDGDAMHQRRA